MIFWRSRPVNSKEFEQLSELILKLEVKVKELSSAVTMLEIDIHNTRDKIMKRIRPKDLTTEIKSEEPKKDTIFLRPDGQPID